MSGKKEEQLNLLELQNFCWQFGDEISELHTKILGKLLCVERGTHENDLKVISEVE